MCIQRYIIRTRFWICCIVLASVYSFQQKKRSLALRMRENQCSFFQNRVPFCVTNDPFVVTGEQEVERRKCGSGITVLERQFDFGACLRAKKQAEERTAEDEDGS